MILALHLKQLGPAGLNTTPTLGGVPFNFANIFENGDSKAHIFYLLEAEIPANPAAYAVTYGQFPSGIAPIIYTLENAAQVAPDVVGVAVTSDRFDLTVNQADTQVAIGICGSSSTANLNADPDWTPDLSVGSIQFRALGQSAPGSDAQAEWNVTRDASGNLAAIVALVGGV